ncbi:MBL fold metallo-hydrolase [Streptomyces sp. F001]|uniref:MBL fold metallo-hydrolase n=1 Tax=Streptomyces sp. F001 TaxID=1510026 RepID=UPI00101E7721|nr:MBL fold metallo-hydrolase [Streptomyces sp. F001]RZB14583.1 MBL fold metallo-hydrolase [Streptomyces sp. F001]
MAMERWDIGDVTVTKVEEVAHWQPLEWLDDALPGSSRAEVEAIDWLRPTYVKDGMINMSVHALLIQTLEKKLVVDTGIGNGKKRAMEMFHMLDTDFLERFEKVWAPAEVDGVVCTHLHVDHVGWNTRLVDGAWVPTFPNAEHFFVKQEYDHWKAYAETRSGDEAGDGYTDWAHDMVDGVAVFEDSVKPVVDAGLVTYVDAGDYITPEVSLIATHGHTPGHVAVLIESRGESAVITGDLMHAPCQVGRPDWSASLDTDDKASAVTRRAFLERFADTGTLVIGTHFGTPSAGQVRRLGDSFRIVPEQ